MSTYGVEFDGHLYRDIGSPLNEIINSNFGIKNVGKVYKLEAIKGDTIHAIHIYAKEQGWFSTTYMVREEDLGNKEKIEDLNRPFTLRLFLAEPLTLIKEVTLHQEYRGLKGTKAKNIKSRSRRMKHMKRSEKKYSIERTMQLKKRSMKRK